MRKSTNHRTYLQRDFDALAMAIEDGRWSDQDPRATAIVEAARSRGLSTAAVDVVTDVRAPAPVRERALACIAGQLLAEGDYALAG